MRDAAAYSAIALAAGVLLLLTFVVARRFVAAVRRRQAAQLRPALEAEVVAYLAAVTEVPPLIETDAQRRVLEAIALEMLFELRGGERTRLAEVLERAGVVDAACRRLASRRKRTSRRAADALSLFRSAQATAALVAALDHRDIWVRLGCARALAELADDEVVPAVAAVAADTAERLPGAVADLLLSLAVNAPTAIGEMIAAGPLELRRLGAAVAGELRMAELAPLLRAAIGSDDDELAARAARGSGLIGDADAVPALLATLRDTARASFVRAAAAKAIGMVGDAGSVAALEAELASDTWWVQSNAAVALAQLGAEGRDALERATASTRSDVRAHAAAALDR